MECCRFVDYSGRPDSLVELYDYRCVTRDILEDVKYVVPQDRFRQVEVGDSITVYIVDNRREGIQGMLTIWHNKEIACLDKGEGKIWGEWDAENKLVLTDEFDEVNDECGMARIGRIAYNTFGIQGKYTGGKFYTLFRGESITFDHEMKGGCTMECPKCKAKIGIMKHTLTVNTGAVPCIKCYICGYWVQTDPRRAQPSLEQMNGMRGLSQGRGQVLGAMDLT